MLLFQLLSPYLSTGLEPSTALSELPPTTSTAQLSIDEILCPLSCRLLFGLVFRFFPMLLGGSGWLFSKNDYWQE